MDIQTENGVSHFTLEDRNTLIELKVALQNLKEGFADFKESLKEDKIASKSDVKDIEARVRILENFRWWILGMGILGGVVVHFLLDKIKFS